MVSPCDTACHATRSAIEPSLAGFAQLLRSETLFQAQGDAGFRSSAEDVPSFGFAVLQSDRPRVRIVRMNLNGKWLAREQQLEQTAKICGLATGALVPDFADCTYVMACVTPRT